MVKGVNIKMKTKVKTFNRNIDMRDICYYLYRIIRMIIDIKRNYYIFTAPLFRRSDTDFILENNHAISNEKE